jgi:hypothetical protein
MREINVIMMMMKARRGMQRCDGKKMEQKLVSNEKKKKFSVEAIEQEKSKTMMRLMTRRSDDNTFRVRIALKVIVE